MDTPPYPSPHRLSHSLRAIHVSVVVLLTLAVALFIASHDSNSATSFRVLGVQQSWQPETPIAAAFFYPWYPSHWSEAGLYPYTNYMPSLGYYDSADDDTIREQISLARRAHLDAMIVSWFGPAEVTDTTLQHILSVSDEDDSNMRWAAYYEEEGYTDPPPAQIAGDLAYLDANVFGSPSYLRVGGIPVLFAYGSGSEDCLMADRWKSAQQLSGIDVFLVLKVFGGYSQCVNQPDSWHQYSPSVYFDSQLPHSASVSPGFWKIGEEPLLDRQPDYFEYAVQWMVATNAQFQLVTTWNEWAEGTGVEPSAEYGEEYIDILCRNLPGSTPCVTAPPSATPPQPTPTVTATPSIAPPPAPTNTPGQTIGPSVSPAQTSLPPPTPTSTPVTTAGPGYSPDASTTMAPIPGSVWGDVDCNGSFEAQDVLMTLRALTAVSPPGIDSSCSGESDVNCDQVTNANDILIMLRRLAGLAAPDCVLS
jgi:hypothetical protein